MPYEWHDRLAEAPAKSGASPYAEAAGAGTEKPICTLSIWPYRSLPKRGFVIFIAATSLLLLVPLVPLLGTPLLWGLLPFLVGAVSLMWYFLNRSYRDGEVLEVLTIHRDRMELVRQEPGGKARRWEANPYWVRVILHPTGGPVPSYLTLKGGEREVELGAFLSEDERKALHGELRDRLARVNSPPS